MIHQGDKIILKAVNYTGVICGKGTVCYFQKMVGDKYECSLTNSENDVFLVQHRHILQIIDGVTNTITYHHDVSDGL